MKGRQALHFNQGHNCSALPAMVDATSYALFSPTSAEEWHYCACSTCAVAACPTVHSIMFQAGFCLRNQHSKQPGQAGIEPRACLWLLLPLVSLAVLLL